MALLLSPSFALHQKHHSLALNQKKSKHPFHSTLASLSLPSQKPHQNPRISDLQSSLPKLVDNLCRSQNLNEAIALIQNQSSNFCCNSSSTSEALGLLIQSCGQQKKIEIGRKVHNLVSTHFGNDLVLNARLITMYSLCGSPSDSRIVFDQLKMKNLFVWNAMISAYTKNEDWEDGLLLFMDLVSGTWLKPDNFTLPCVIKSCVLSGKFEVGEMIHGLAVKFGLVSDVFVGNALIAFYGKWDHVGNAVKVFERMPQRNLVSWNSMIRVYSENGLHRESFDALKNMFEDGECLLPDVATIVTTLPSCAKEENVEMGVIIHGLAVKLGLSQEVTVNNALIDMYAKCGFSFEAQLLFEKNRNRNMVSWNSIIWNFSREGNALKAFELLRQMQIEGAETMVNGVTVLNVLPAFSHKSQLISLKELHGYSLKQNFMHDELVANAFIAAYAKCDSLSSAGSVFHGIETKTVNSWNALIGVHKQFGDPKLALDLYQQMTSLGSRADWFTISNLLSLCAELRLFPSGKQIHAFVLRNRLDMDPYITVALLSFYLCCDKPHFAKAVFDRVESRNLVSWNAMISGYYQNGYPYDALDVLHQMLEEGIRPDEIAVTSLLGACSQLSCLWPGKEIHCFILKADLTRDSFVACSIIDMYAKCGCIELSRRFFDSLAKRDLPLWTALISGYGVHGCGSEALLLFEEMQRAGLKPDHLTFIGVLMACSHAGLVREGLECFNSMCGLHGIEPKLEHYACVVDMLARAGQLYDAFKLVDNMPMKADSKIWSSLVSSCMIHGDMMLGGIAAQKLLELEPNRAENYVLVSNLLASYGEWDDSASPVDER